MVLMAIFSFSGTRPDDLGYKAGKFKPCPKSPNCVCSQADDDDHKIAPIAFDGTAAEGMQKLKALLGKDDTVKIVEGDENYLYAEFTSGFFGFVDDVEFAVGSKLIQVRSASRIGYGDMGANRKRIEEIRRQFTSQ